MGRQGLAPKTSAVGHASQTQCAGWVPQGKPTHKHTSQTQDTRQQATPFPFPCGSWLPKPLNPKGSLSAKARKSGGKFEPATCPGGDFDVIGLSFETISSRRLCNLFRFYFSVLRSYSLVWICPITRVLSESSRAIIRAELLNPKP